jgi:ubiquinone/menaquinone biosynthesis C-methylase UbiE
MILLLKKSFRYLIFKILGASVFARWIEWRKLLKWLDPQKGERILDIACGAGDLSLKIAEKGCEVHGIDMSAIAIDSAKSLSELVKIKGEFTVGDAERLPYADGYFNKVVCSSSLEHFKDDARSLSEMRRVVKPGGTIILTVDSFTFPIVPKLKERHRRLCAVEHYYTREDMAQALQKTGLTMKRSEYLLTSDLTSLVFEFWIKRSDWANLFLLMTFFSPLLLLSDTLFGKKDMGYTLIVEAIK